MTTPALSTVLCSSRFGHLGLGSVSLWLAVNRPLPQAGEQS